MIEILVFVLIGVLLGIFTGLVPGVHVNTVIILIIAVLPVMLAYFSVYEVIALVISMGVTHTFVDYIPSILMGAPDDTSVLSILPGHRMLMEGRGLEAIRLTVIGGLGAIILGSIFLTFGVFVLPLLYHYTRQILPFLLLGVLLHMVYTERSVKRRAFSIVVILYSGILGVIILEGNILSLKYALFPTLTGLFGISTILMSLRTRPEIPPQDLGSSKGSAKIHKNGIVAGTFAGILAGLLPSIGSAQSALIVQTIFNKGDKDGDNEKEFLVALGGVNTSDAVYALFALYLIGNPRSGASIAVQHILGGFTFNDFIFMVSIVLITVFFAVFATLLIARIFVRKVQDINYQEFSKSIIVFLVALILLITGLKGFLIAVVATSIGIIAHLTGIKKSHMMAVLIVPTIMYFW